MSFGDWVISGFNELTPDLESIYNDARSEPLSSWRSTQQALVTGSGAAAAAVPGLHLVGMAADVAFLMNRMAVCSYGIGAIVGNSRGLGSILEKEDFAIILARWSGDDHVCDAAIGKTAADLVGKVGGKSLTKLLAKTAAEKAGILAGKKLAGKVGMKVGAKFGAKLGTKAVAGWVPFLGAAVGGGINLWFITEIADAAQSWYELKVAACGGESSAGA